MLVGSLDMVSRASGNGGPRSNRSITLRAIITNRSNRTIYDKCTIHNTQYINWHFKQFQFLALNRSHMRDLGSLIGGFCVKFRRASFFVKITKIDKSHISNISRILGIMETSISNISRIVEIGKIRFPICPGWKKIWKIRCPYNVIFPEIRVSGCHGSIRLVKSVSKSRFSDTLIIKNGTKLIFI